MRRLREYPPEDELEADGEVDPVFKPPPLSRTTSPPAHNGT
jgi:hypothetical protein